MQAIRKSLIRKLFLYLGFFVFLLISLIYFLSYFQQKTVSLNFFLITLASFSIFFLLIYWVDVIQPLRKILVQMQALITNRPYKRIYSSRIDEIGVIVHFFNQVTKGLKEVSYDIQDRERMLGELTIASQLQRDILPEEIPKIKGLQVVAKTRPASELGGDSFNYLKAGGKNYIYIGDVTGHGVAAGLVMTMVHTLINVFSSIHNSPYEILVKVNKYIKKHLQKAMFMTLVMFSWDEKAEKMTYVGAGHEHILVYRSETSECEAIMSGGVALGMVPDNSTVIQEKELELHDGDVVVLYSDGITEAKNKNGEMYGIDRLKQAVMEYSSQYSAEGINHHVAQDLATFMAGAEQKDDITLIVMKRVLS